MRGKVERGQCSGPMAGASVTVACSKHLKRERLLLFQVNYVYSPVHGGRSAEYQAKLLRMKFHTPLLAIVLVCPGAAFAQTMFDPMPKEELRALAATYQEELTGLQDPPNDNGGAIGLGISKRNGDLVVLSPIEGRAAEKSGMRSKDVIVVVVSELRRRL